MKSPLIRLRFWPVVIIVGLVLSGVTAFPLMRELNLLSKRQVGADASWNPEDHTGLAHWILFVREGLETTY